MRIELAGSLEGLGIDTEIARWSDADLMRRFWAKDPTVWFPGPTDEIANRLGWLDLPESSVAHVAEIESLASAARELGIHHVVLCGMGGSSLAPEVLSATLPTGPGYPDLIVLDSTHPDAIHDVTARIQPRSTWFVISSKSGSTLETRSFLEYFWDMVLQSEPSPGNQFIAITDPDSDLANLGHEREFRSVFLADPDVGGRYSALTHFGLVPAGLIGADIRSLLESARSARAMCGPDTPMTLNPGLQIGATMAVAAQQGRDKCRFIGTGPGEHFGVWVEQLIAESTGKSGTGIIPVDHGPSRDAPQDELVIAVGAENDGEADITINIVDPSDIGGAMFIMEFATAVAGEILGIHPFNQPDVQRAKELANEAMNGSLKSSTGPVSIRDPAIGDALESLLATLDGSYVSIQAYLNPNRDTTTALGRLRSVVAAKTGLACTVGFGPRFLHSTGQLHKGGPPGGLFVQLVDEPIETIQVPHATFTFNELILGQAAGDRQALLDADRSLVSIDLGDARTEGVIAIANRIAIDQ
jgi:transaldolase / glucose-6-phosphate isomerase